MAGKIARAYEGAETYIPMLDDCSDEEMNLEVEQVVDGILKDYQKGRDIDNLKFFEQPDRDQIVVILDELLAVLFPGYYREKVYHTVHTETKISVIIEDVMYRLRKQIELALLYDERYADVDRAQRKKAAKKSRWSSSGGFRKSGNIWIRISRRPLKATRQPTANTKLFYRTLEFWRRQSIDWPTACSA